MPGSMGQGNAWHWNDPGGKEGEWVELSGHQSFHCKLTCCSWTTQPVQLVGLAHSPTCAHGKCVWVCKILLCEGMSVGYKGQGETRHTGLPTIHCRWISWRYLLFRISSAPSNIPYHTAKSFWRVSLSWLSHWSFFPCNFFFLLWRNETIPIIILWWWWKLQSSLFLIDSLGGLG